MPDINPGDEVRVTKAGATAPADLGRAHSQDRRKYATAEYETTHTDWTANPSARSGQSSSTWRPAGSAAPTALRHPGTHPGPDRGGRAPCWRPR